MDNSRMEIIWGVKLLDEGFTSIPNILIRNYRKLNINHGEWGLICTILTYKHDHRDPYPSEVILAEHLQCDQRQIRKWIKSLKDKNLVWVGRRRNVNNKRWDNNVYSFKPLIDAALKLMGESPLPETNDDYDIEWENKTTKVEEINPPEPEVPMDPPELKVPMDLGPEVPLGLGPEVPLKKKNKKENLKITDGRTDNIHINPKIKKEWELFKGFCEKHEFDGSQIMELYKVWRHHYSKAPVNIVISTLREMIHDSVSFSGKAQFKNVIGIFHHRMKVWQEMAIAFEEIDKK